MNTMCKVSVLVNDETDFMAKKMKTIILFYAMES